MANKNHTQVKNDYRLIMKEKDTTIQNIQGFSECDQNSQKLTFNFVQIFVIAKIKTVLFV